MAVCVCVCFIIAIRSAISQEHGIQRGDLRAFCKVLGALASAAGERPRARRSRGLHERIQEEASAAVRFFSVVFLCFFTALSIRELAEVINSLSKVFHLHLRTVGDCFSMSIRFWRDIAARELRGCFITVDYLLALSSFQEASTAVRSFVFFSLLFFTALSIR